MYITIIEIQIQNFPKTQFFFHLLIYRVLSYISINGLRTRKILSDVSLGIQ